MDANRFDHLTRWVSAGGNRRSILALLSGLPLSGVVEFLTGDERAEAKRRKSNARQRKERKRRTSAEATVGDDALPHKKHCRRVKGKGHGHHGRRKNCQAHHRPGNGKTKGKNKGQGSTQPCQPESLAQTCAGTCGSVQNNCQETVDCGSCACNPTCPACQTCDEVRGQCQPDPAQDGQTCAGCQICDNGQCIPDPSIVCTPLDQCHEAGVCDPATGECTNPVKTNGTSCDDGDPCTTGDTCQDGACVGTPKDCSAEGDICNDGVCRADGTCGKRAKQDGTSCNADNDSCTAGDSCQNGVCTAGAGVNCSSLGDACNTGVCRTADGQCIKQQKADGTPCGDDGTCQGGACQEAICKGLGATCNPGNNRCCQDNPTSCAALAPNCYASGDPQDERCCHQTRETCGDDCECCGIAACEGGSCCNHPGGVCRAQADCCTNRVPAECSSGTCCVTEGQSCEEDADCCSGSCPDGACVGCLPLQTECENADECCQAGGATFCRESIDFTAHCCRPKGGTCRENDDCCDGRACNNGRCCEGENVRCDSNADCCSGLECRGSLCRTNICREAGEACPPDSPGCCPGSGSCTDGVCCYQLGQACEEVPFLGNPCCGSYTECGGANGATCCIQDFAYAFNDDAACTSDDQCCSGYCHGNKMCCRPQGAACSEIGPLNFECCPYLGLACSANGAGTCIPCRKPGQSCEGSGSSSTCCIGGSCDNGVCVLHGCGIGGSVCQDSSTCCEGFLCNAGGICLKVCEPEGERCDSVAGFPCCNGLTCSGEYPSERCVSTNP